MISYYAGDHAGQLGRIFSSEYYWWESGAVCSGLIDYWAYTGDDQYNDFIQQALTSQVGPDNDYMPPNQTKTEGNDDQGMWALWVDFPLFLFGFLDRCCVIISLILVIICLTDKPCGSTVVQRWRC